ncbi:MAG TPA: hypothetical protein VHT73_06410 [Thermodesulfobacteriota bacterium]|nr:hypothetical protein [Thermodesulfobacteriota bacterium]
MKIPLPKNEDARLNAPYRYNILGTPPEKEFDELTRLAAYICRTPTALIAFLNADHEWFKSKVGLHISEIPHDVSFSAHVVYSPTRF